MGSALSAEGMGDDTPVTIPGAIRQPPRRNRPLVEFGMRRAASFRTSRFRPGSRTDSQAQRTLSHIQHGSLVRDVDMYTDGGTNADIHGHAIGNAIGNVATVNLGTNLSDGDGQEGRDGDGTHLWDANNDGVDESAIRPHTNSPLHPHPYHTLSSHIHTHPISHTSHTSTPINSSPTTLTSPNSEPQSHGPVARQLATSSLRRLGSRSHSENPQLSHQASLVSPTSTLQNNGSSRSLSSSAGSIRRLKLRRSFFGFGFALGVYRRTSEEAEDDVDEEGNEGNANGNGSGREIICFPVTEQEFAILQPAPLFVDQMAEQAAASASHYEKRNVRYLCERIVKKAAKANRPYSTLSASIASSSSASSDLLSSSSSLKSSRNAPTLYELCLCKIVSECTDVSSLPLEHLSADMIQDLLDLLIYSKKFNAEFFRNVANRVPCAVSYIQAQHGIIKDDSWIRSLPCLELSLIKLDLKGCVSLTDTACPFICRVPSLRILELDGCIALTSRGINCFRNLRNLEILRINGLFQLADEAFEGFANLKQLRILEMRGCSDIGDVGLMHLKGLTLLSELNIANCFLLSDYSLVRLLPNFARLETLNMAYTQVSSAVGQVLARSPCKSSLRRLNLSGTHVLDDDSGWISSFSNLESLRVSRCDVGDQFLYYTDNLRNMKDFDLSYTMISDRSVVNHLANMTKMESLSLEYTSISDLAIEAGLSKLTNLKSLNISETSVSSTGIEGLKNLAGLEELNFSRSNINRVQLDNLLRLSRLKKLEVDSSNLGDEIITCISQLPDLEAVDLFSCRITDKGLEPIRKMKKLTSIEICGGLLTNKGIRHLAKVSTLKSISIAHNSMVGNSGIAHLLPLDQLNYLNIGFTSINDCVVSILEDFVGLEVVAVNGCKLSASAFKRLTDAFQVIGNPILIEACSNLPDLPPPSPPVQIREVLSLSSSSLVLDGFVLDEPPLHFSGSSIQAGSSSNHQRHEEEVVGLVNSEELALPFITI